jgi:hypothetical protein
MGKERDVVMSSASDIKGILDQLRVLETLDESYMSIRTLGTTTMGLVRAIPRHVVDHEAESNTSGIGASR